MIKVTFKYTEDKKTLVLNVTGHSGYDNSGKDIICSASTILAYTVAQVVNDLYKCGMLAKKPNISLKEGNASITCKPKDESYSEALHTFFVAEVGYDLLSKNFPEFVELTPFVTE